MTRTVTAAATVTAWCLFALTIGWPLISIIERVVAQGLPPTDGYTLSSRQLALLWRSVWLAGITTLTSGFLAIVAAYAIIGMGGLFKRPAVAAMLLCLLLCPPMVYAFGWERLLPSNVNPYLKCIGVWALWGWPIPALLITSGWMASARCGYEAARLETPRLPAFLRVGLPTLGPYLAISSFVLFLFYVTDYGVPHACGLIVYATELLTWAASSSLAIDQLWLGLPLIILTLALLGASFVCFRNISGEQARAATGEDGRRRVRHFAVLGSLVAFSWGLPLAALLTNLESCEAVREAILTYDRDIGLSLATAALGATLAMILGYAALANRVAGRGALFATVAMGAIPGSLVGAALIAAYNRPNLWWIYDHWPVVVLAYVARFAWVGMLVAMASVSRLERAEVSQARVDGASAIAVFRHVQLPTFGPVWLCGMGIITTMALAESNAVAMIRVPGFSPISLILIEKFHRFEHQILISLSLCLVAATVPAAVLLLLVLRRRWQS